MVRQSAHFAVRVLGMEPKKGYIVRAARINQGYKLQMIRSTYLTLDQRNTVFLNVQQS